MNSSKLNALPGGVTIAEIDDAEQASKLGTYSGNRSDSENNIIQLMRSNDHRNEQDERVVFFTGADHFNEQVQLLLGKICSNTLLYRWKIAKIVFGW